MKSYEVLVTVKLPMLAANPTEAMREAADLVRDSINEPNARIIATEIKHP
jgi:hypothetical protein